MLTVSLESLFFARMALPSCETVPVTITAVYASFSLIFVKECSSSKLAINRAKSENAIMIVIVFSFFPLLAPAHLAVHDNFRVL